MMQKKFVFRQLSRYIIFLSTRRIQFLLQNVHVVSFQTIMTLFADLSEGAKTYLPCNFSILVFSALTERLCGTNSVAVCSNILMLN